MNDENAVQSLDRILLERRTRLGKQDWFWEMALDICSAYLNEIRCFEICRAKLKKSMEESDGTEPDIWEICRDEERLKESMDSLCKFMTLWFTEIMEPEMIAKHPLKKNDSDGTKHLPS